MTSFKLHPSGMVNLNIVFRVILVISCSFAVNAGLVQKPNLVLPPDAATHHTEVKAIFMKSYKSCQRMS